MPLTWLNQLSLTEWTFKANIKFCGFIGKLLDKTEAMQAVCAFMSTNLFKVVHKLI